jgi:hypothetical protein
MGLWSYIEDLIDDAVDNIVNIANSIWEALKRLWHKIVFLVKKVISLMSDIVSWIQRTVQSLMRKVSNFASKLKNKIVKFFVMRFKKPDISGTLKNAAKGKYGIPPPIKVIDNLFGIDETKEEMVVFMLDSETDEIEEMEPMLSEEMGNDLRELMGNNEIIELQGKE